MLALLAPHEPAAHAERVLVNILYAARLGADLREECGCLSDGGS